MEDISFLETCEGMEEDVFDLDYNGANETSVEITSVGASNYGKAIMPLPRSKTCALCNNDSEEESLFVGPYPFILPLTDVESKKVFWVHEACAKFSPEVFFTDKPEVRWFNVAQAVRRGRNIRCGGCRQRGATIGCFEPKCTKSYHVFCTQKTLDKFEDGLIFWCTTHEVKYNRIGIFL